MPGNTSVIVTRVQARPWFRLPKSHSYLPVIPPVTCQVVSAWGIVPRMRLAWLNGVRRRRSERRTINIGLSINGRFAVKLWKNFASKRTCSQIGCMMTGWFMAYDLGMDGKYISSKFNAKIRFCKQ